MNKTNIEWADKTWNPITGCTPISEGCKNCYAMRMANRLKGRFGYPSDEPFKVTTHPDKLKDLRFGKGKKIFVCSMSDIFHRSVPIDYIQKVFEIAIKDCNSNIFIFLTKRPELMVERLETIYQILDKKYIGISVPTPNIWLGVSVENQQRAEERIPYLMEIPAAVRLVSVEPMLGPVDLSFSKSYLDWVICGSESGYNARPFKSQWAENLLEQCIGVDIPFFYKQGVVNGCKVKTPQLQGQSWTMTPYKKGFYENTI